MTSDSWVNERTHQFVALLTKHAPDLTVRGNVRGAEFYDPHHIHLFRYQKGSLFKAEGYVWTLQVCRKLGAPWETTPFEYGWEAIRIWVFERRYYPAMKAFSKDYKRLAGKKAVVLLRDSDIPWSLSEIRKMQRLGIVYKPHSY